MLGRMDVDGFLAELPGLFFDFPASETPSDRRFQPLLDQVEGLAAENNLALVNLAASKLEAGESYVEVGSWKGLSLIAAALGNRGDFVGIDHFAFRDGSRAELQANVDRFGVAGVTVVQGEAFSLLPDGMLDGRCVGVYYYDAAHGYDAQLEGLRLIEPYLATRALLIVDDSDWEQVGRATADYVAEQPRARLALEILGKTHGQPQWWEGVHLIDWRAAQ